jgi:hypothetical protein
MWEAVKRALGLQTEPERLAREAFLSLHPGEHVAWTHLTADETDRYVVGVYYGTTRPPSYAFFAVTKGATHVEPLVDDEPYRPRVWR